MSKKNEAPTITAVLSSVEQKKTRSQCGGPAVKARIPALSGERDGFAKDVNGTR